ncbi:hypothetical protein HPB47_025074 [Ixodes persulcatus]|uniref:Uncharacterized protein n=1 Tax=Ixodes persulcatus TaxID=34615 RepID=A0AC60Q4E2_IXOPE|nr:hypothetical protein HPB47_025074 [Ixodes persulcatus]
MSNKIQIRINSNQNILAVHTEDEETARALTRVHQLTLGGKSYPSYTYLAAPDDSIKGVIHDVKPGSTTEELLDFIRVGNGPQIITARMLGQSSSALITFEGRKLPSYVIYSASRQRVLPYRPPRHICTRCFWDGHRADVCPTPTIRICTQCATHDPTPDHACTPKCVLCDGQHPTGDKMCQKRYNDHQSRQDNTTKQPETVPEWAKVLMNMLTRITSRVDRIEQQLMSPEMELKSPTPPPAQPEDAQQTIARLQETIARLQEQLRATTEKEQIVKKARKTDEPDLIRITQALIISRIVYATPYLALTARGKGKMDVIIRKAYKIALAPTARSPQYLPGTGGRSFSKPERERLALTQTGRRVLSSLGIPIPSTYQETTQMPQVLRDKIQTAPIPRNMNPSLHAGRRKARAEALHWTYDDQNNVKYTDAATYPDRTAAVASVIDHKMNTIVTASVETTLPVVAEEMAIAFAIALAGDSICYHQPNEPIPSSAIRRYKAGRISTQANQLLLKSGYGIPNVKLVWTPGHESVEGNRQAHAVARTCIIRAPSLQMDHPEPVPNQFSEILAHQREMRYHFPPPDQNLSREEAAAWRQIQTNTYTHLANLHKFYPDRYSDKCPHCGEYPTLYHVTWACPSNPSLPPKPHTTNETWEAALLSSSVQSQRELIERAKIAAESTGALD